ncbi:LOW QUALITY PROTEIN: tubulin monoglycylase TTLL3 [Falco rusticolus]|uniref:LOW QUALITY PROTEIN: tubulin monoglycylase TTLL3 n=1 Tax=Falco rusticolus TaxID=120794 RepID=UPI0018866018|nr:LOW QUALITY PROTEIN: tubulin monoglycylase TTLL3 [Falco rusticolus]
MPQREQPRARRAHGWGQRSARGAVAGAEDIPAVPWPARLGTRAQQGISGPVQCSRDTSMKLGRPAKAMSGTTSSVRQRQAGQATATTTGHRSCHHPLLNPDQFKRARLRVERAIKEKKIFTVQGPYPVMRSLLRARGWVERKLPSTGRVGSCPEQQHGSQERRLQEEDEGSDGAEQGEAVLDLQLGSPCHEAQPLLGTPGPLSFSWPPNEEEEEEEEEQWDEDPDGIHDLMSCLVRDQVPNFIWTSRCSTDCRLLRQDQVVNHYAGVGAFTTKEGLCQNLRNLPWFDQADPDTFFPRCYRLGAADERQAFIEDFRLTAARGLLRVALERAGGCAGGDRAAPEAGEGPAGSGSLLPPQLVEEALQVCRQHLASLGHQDIDWDPSAPRMTDADWDRFLRDYYHVVHLGARLVLSEAQREQCRALLCCLAEQLPQFGMEGDRNVWILKPGAKSCGRGKARRSWGWGTGSLLSAGPPTVTMSPGIVCTARLGGGAGAGGGCRAPSARVGSWVVQKYVERLLLIFGTKFDIRQWFLVTNWNPLTVWFYRESYLRFCSQPFSLRRLDPARHLCNVSIQKQFKSVRSQHPQLPPDRIWSSRQFQAYLAQVGQADVWHQVMVPGMKAAVVGTLRSTRDLVRSRKGSFELYGADFAFGEDYQPWLLEINVSPTMAPSSVVTSRLCANVQRDTLRVVLDRKDNPTCPTGAFELIYKEAVMPRPLAVGLKLTVEGHSLRKPQSQGKPPTAAPAAHQPIVPPSPWGRASQVPHPAAAWEKLVPLGRWNRRCPTGSARPAPLQSPRCCAGSCCSSAACSGHPRQLCCSSSVHPLARVPIPPPRGAPSQLLGTHRPAPLLPSRRGMTPTQAGTWHPDPVPPKPCCREGACSSSQGGHRRAVTLKAIQERTTQHPVPHSWSSAAAPARPHLSQTPSLGRGTQPTLRGGCNKRL